MTRLWTVFLRFIQLLLVYVAVRGVFYVWNFSDMSTATVPELLNVFLMGVRFDISAVLTVNAIFYLFWLWPWQASGWQNRLERASVVLYFVLNIFFIGTNVADVELARFNGRRLTPQFFRLGGDVEDQIGQLILHYWPLSLLLVVLAVFLMIAFPRQKTAQERRSWLGGVLIALCLPFVILGIRGGLQDKPLREAHAYSFSSPELGNLALNTAFTFIHSKGYNSGEVVRLVSQPQMRRWMAQMNATEATPQVSAAHGIFRGHNVVILILESFAREYMGKVNHRPGYTPFLDALTEKALFFDEAFANGRRSIEAVPAIFSSLPSLYQEPFLLSDRQNMTLSGLPRDLTQAGYDTNFFHGAKNGSMFFDSFGFRVGMQHYYGLSEYPNADKDYDGFWGILDEPYLQYFKGMLDEKATPFFATLFTLSSHQPYPVPANLRSQFPTGTLEIHPAVAYTDYSLRKFFEAAEKSPWYKDTLFVLVADHTQKSDDPNYANDLGVYRIPIIFFHPGMAPSDWPAVDTHQPIKQADIYPTILDLLGLPGPAQPTGRSVFARSPAYVVNRTAEGFWYLDDKYFLKMSEQGDEASLHDTADVMQPIKLSQDAEPWLRFKSYVQYVLNGLTAEVVETNSAGADQARQKN